jgi:thioredoxin-related protein
MVRPLLAILLLAVGLLGSPAAHAAVPRLGDDGLYHTDWFYHGLLNLSDDLKAATASGKRLALVWEQRGCVYCKQMSTVTLLIPKVQDFIRKHYTMVLLNLHGDRQVTDFDGNVMSEHDLASHYGIHVTPTIQFIKADPKQVVGHTGEAAVEQARMPGLLPTDDFLAMFQWVYATPRGEEDFSTWASKHGG